MPQICLKIFCASRPASKPPPMLSGRKTNFVLVSSGPPSARGAFAEQQAHEERAGYREGQRVLANQLVELGGAVARALRARGLGLGYELVFLQLGGALEL